MTISQFKISAINQLKDFSPSPQLDVQVFLEFSLGYSKTQILLKKDEEILSEKIDWLNSAIESRKTGLPVAYIIGHKEFFGYDFLVNPSVLIPKPDTEILVEKALDAILLKIEKKPEKLFKICDMCTGSGCIGISVMKSLIEKGVRIENLPKFTMVDISSAALEVAKNNFSHIFDLNKLDSAQQDLLKNRMHFVQSNLFEFVPSTFDFILTNPPYIPHKLVEELLKDGRMEPVLALNGDVTITGDRARKLDGSLKNDGLEIIRNLMPQIREHLAPLGKVFMETGEYNAEDAALLANKWGFKTKIHKDLEGQLRVVEMRG